LNGGLGLDVERAWNCVKGATAMRRQILLSSVALFVSIGAAFAAAPAPVFNWSGFYIGVDAGAGFGSSSWSNIVVPSATGEDYPGVFARHDLSGVVGGVTGGYNFQTGAFVYGVSGTFNFGDVDGMNKCFGNYGDFNAQCTDDVERLGDLSARLGFTPIDKALLYVQGGVAYEGGTASPANENYEGSYIYTNGYQKTDFDRWGYALGVGAEFAADEHWVVGLDYKYYGFDKSSVSFTPVPPLNDYSPPFSADIKNNVQTVTLHVGYKF
jgi:outer membrane immunogenic protein